jgi:hypothetical protein
MKKILSLILSFMIFLFLSIPVYAEGVTDTVVGSYDNTSIEEDLAGVDLSGYPKNKFGDAEIISMMEYCFSYNSSISSSYGLYVYVYNPSCVPLDRDMCSVTIVVEYPFLEEIKFETYNPDLDSFYRSFDKLSLIYLDSTSDYLFYKFKIDLPSTFLSNMQAFSKMRKDLRRYEIVELEVKKRGENIKASSDQIYVWSGFASYCAPDGSEESTLSCKNYGTRSIHLELDHTNYRGGFRGDICDDLNTVIFTLPESYFQEFGNLNSIYAQWYEYITAPMYVTSDVDAYRSLWNMRNIFINEFGQEVNNNGSPVGSTLNYTRVLWEQSMKDIPNSMELNGWYLFNKAYNPKCRDDVAPLPQFTYNGYVVDLSDTWSYESIISWLFYVENVTGPDAYCVSKDDVKDYMRKYSNDFSEDLILDKYASNLFSQNKGLQKLKIYNEDFSSFVGNSSSQSWWDKLWNGKQYDTITYDPIVIVEECDLVLTESEFSELYLVNINDAASIMDRAREAFDNNERTVLLRFAVRDYYASAARFDYVDYSNSNPYQTFSNVNGYVAQETVFLDFDIISLGFVDSAGADEIVLGVVADPIDIINGLTPPDELVVTEQEWWQMLVALLLLILLAVVFSALFPVVNSVFKIILNGILFILKLFFEIIGIPFKMLSRLFSTRRR